MTKVKKSPLKHKRYKTHRGSDGIVYGEELYHEKYGGSVEDKPVADEKTDVTTVIEPSKEDKKTSRVYKPIVKGTGFYYPDTEEEKAEKKEQAKIVKATELTEKIGEDNTNIISEFLNVDASDISVVQGTDDTKGTFRVTHDGKGDEENYFSQPKFVNINDDGVVSFLTEDEVRREDPKFYDTHNKVEELKYWEKAEDMSYFDDFNNWDDKYDEDRVVAHLNYKLKKYGITARVAPYRFAEDYIILSDGKGNTQEINLGAFEGADFWSPGSPGFLGGGPEKQLSHLYYNRRPSFSTTSRSGKLEDAYLITNFVKEHGRQYDSLVWSETRKKSCCCRVKKDIPLLTS